mmetsp:Transcript_27371/g.93416  ORF Transcript_27371/g.93416 Transcript_27371/m.93416 type:complete len:1616 (-) Transcript_27371:84-4931(-)|eukprot:CAMPEP_0183797720 /NCGR_PEP_ID=MMETSP0803_2-20130417/16805_1 /TAXON_ID=195967 /ORGANISM="Crustomastix stigmata, Strain CCMP3273" /LENGTH=1615 /DNA_ID=CAMNT_0026042393 /DNA_START=87 /DNA_END=4934 /DNA_ORIENTATION=+
MQKSTPQPPDKVRYFFPLEKTEDAKRAGQQPAPFYGHFDAYAPQWIDDPALNTEEFSPLTGFTRMRYARSRAELDNKGIARPRTAPPSRRPNQDQPPPSPGLGLKRHPSAQRRRDAAALNDVLEPKFAVTAKDTLTAPQGKLWDKYNSIELGDTVDIQELTNWATKLAPRTVHDLKPLVVFLQGLLEKVLSGKMKFFAAEILALKQQLDALQRLLEEQQEEYEANLANYINEIKRLGGELEQEQSESFMSSVQLLLANKRNKSKDDLLAHKHQRLSDLEKQILSDEKDKKLADKQREINDLKLQIEKLLEKIGKIERMYAERGFDLQRKDQEIARLNDQIVDMKRAYEKQIEELKEQIKPVVDNSSSLVSSADNVKQRSEGMARKLLGKRLDVTVPPRTTVLLQNDDSECYVPGGTSISLPETENPEDDIPIELPSGTSLLSFTRNRMAECKLPPGCLIEPVPGTPKGGHLVLPPMTIVYAPDGTYDESREYTRMPLEDGWSCKLPKFGVTTVTFSSVPTIDVPVVAGSAFLLSEESAVHLPKGAATWVPYNCKSTVDVQPGTMVLAHQAQELELPQGSMLQLPLPVGEMRDVVLHAFEEEQVASGEVSGPAEVDLPGNNRIFIEEESEVELPSGTFIMCTAGGSVENSPEKGAAFETVEGHMFALSKWTIVRVPEGGGTFYVAEGSVEVELPPGGGVMKTAVDNGMTVDLPAGSALSGDNPLARALNNVEVKAKTAVLLPPSVSHDLPVVHKGAFYVPDGSILHVPEDSKIELPKGCAVGVGAKGCVPPVLGKLMPTGTACAIPSRREPLKVRLPRGTEVVLPSSTTLTSVAVTAGSASIELGARSNAAFPRGAVLTLPTPLATQLLLAGNAKPYGDASNKDGRSEVYVEPGGAVNTVKLEEDEGCAVVRCSAVMISVPADVNYEATLPGQSSLLLRPSEHTLRSVLPKGTKIALPYGSGSVPVMTELPVGAKVELPAGANKNIETSAGTIVADNDYTAIIKEPEKWTGKSLAGRMSMHGAISVALAIPYIDPELAGNAIENMAEEEAATVLSKTDVAAGAGALKAVAAGKIASMLCKMNAGSAGALVAEMGEPHLTNVIAELPEGLAEAVSQSATLFREASEAFGAMPKDGSRPSRKQLDTLGDSIAKLAPEVSSHLLSKAPAEVATAVFQESSQKDLRTAASMLQRFSEAEYEAANAAVGGHSDDMALRAALAQAIKKSTSSAELEEAAMKYMNFCARRFDVKFTVMERDPSEDDEGGKSEPLMSEQTAKSVLEVRVAGARRRQGIGKAAEELLAHEQEGEGEVQACGHEHDFFDMDDIAAPQGYDLVYTTEEQESMAALESQILLIEGQVLAVQRGRSVAHKGALLLSPILFEFNGATREYGTVSAFKAGHLGHGCSCEKGTDSHLLQDCMAEFAKVMAYASRVVAEHEQRFQEDIDAALRLGHAAFKVVEADKKLMAQLYKKRQLKFARMLSNNAMLGNLVEIKSYVNPPVDVCYVMVSLFLLLDTDTSFRKFLGSKLDKWPEDTKDLWELTRAQIILRSRSPVYIIKRLHDKADMLDVAPNEEEAARCKCASRLVEKVSADDAQFASEALVILRMYVHAVVQRTELFIE